MAKATFAAGCFWGVEEAFRSLPGVTETRVGYIGGTLADPTYEQVCTGRTGHAEAVEVDFDPEETTYEELLTAFWTAHDPTQKNRQGWDVGTQYRSAVYYHDEAQKAAAKASRKALDASGRLRGPVATEITPAGQFYAAEEYHQKYLARRGQTSCGL